MKIIELTTPRKQRIGIVNTNNTHLENHEYETIHFLASFGFNIDIIRPTNAPGTRTPDFLLNGAVWEAKCPHGTGYSTIGRQFHYAGRQAERLVLDLRRIKLPAKEAEQESLIRFNRSRRIKHLLLITKDCRLLDISK